MMNSHCQPCSPAYPLKVSSQPEIGEPIMLATGMPTRNAAVARARQGPGNQVGEADTHPGVKPASAIPSNNRAAEKPSAPATNEVRAEINPQVITMRAIQRRAPKRCKARLLGISQMK